MQTYSNLLQPKFILSGATGDYHAFLTRKSQPSGKSGFEPLWMPDFLYPFQVHLVDWSLRTGRAAKHG